MWPGEHGLSSEQGPGHRGRRTRPGSESRPLALPGLRSLRAGDRSQTRRQVVSWKNLEAGNRLQGAVSAALPPGSRAPGTWPPLREASPAGPGTSAALRTPRPATPGVAASAPEPAALPARRFQQAPPARSKAAGSSRDSHTLSAWNRDIFLPIVELQIPPERP